MARKKTPAQKVNDQKENDQKENDQKENACSSANDQGTKEIVETNPPTGIGEKRKLQSIDCNIGNSEENEITTLKKLCVELQDRLARLEKSFLSIPSDINIQEFFEDALPSFSDNNHHDITVNTSDLVMSVDGDTISETNAGSSASNLGNVDDPMTGNCNKRENGLLLAIDDKMLSSLKRENATCSARSILKFLFPDPEIHFKLSNVDKSIVDSIVQTEDHASRGNENHNQQDQTFHVKLFRIISL
ncbi:unnamed protein product [Adineta ricciae]|uniref:BEN domain-containing protein n=1 Tax=Adineta ricciae TaxID=249248 RepID=A0A816AA40_ADIRI|nr:unnamed protein product [Adineta ricciae]CAF1593270.1 unnamed protein product [Adineta ricciae]